MKLTSWSRVPAFYFFIRRLYDGFFSILFTRFNSNRGSLFSLLLCCTFIFSIVRAFLQWYWSKDTLTTRAEQEKATRHVLTGLAGIALSGIIPRLLSTILAADRHTMYCYFELSNCSYLLFFCVLCYDYENYIELRLGNYLEHFNIIKFIIISQLFLLMLSIRRAFSDGASTEVYVFHYYFTWVFMASSIEFYMHWKDGVHLRIPKVGN